MAGLLVYEALYTHQKQKKAKTWQDGVLKFCHHQKKAWIYDDKGSKLDTVLGRQQVCPGDEFESDRYLIQVEGLLTAQPTPPASITPIPSAIAVTAHYPNRLPSVGSSGTRGLAGRRVGLKRTAGKAGFFAPRQIKAVRSDEISSLPVTVTALQANKAQQEQTTVHTLEQIKSSPAANLFSLYSSTKPTLSRKVESNPTNSGHYGSGPIPSQPGSFTNRTPNDRRSSLKNPENSGMACSDASLQIYTRCSPPAAGLTSSRNQAVSDSQKGHVGRRDGSLPEAQSKTYSGPVRRSASQIMALIHKAKSCDDHVKLVTSMGSDMDVYAASTTMECSDSPLLRSTSSDYIGSHSAGGETESVFLQMGLNCHSPGISLDVTNHVRPRGSESSNCDGKLSCGMRNAVGGSPNLWSGVIGAKASTPPVLTPVGLLSSSPLSPQFERPLGSANSEEKGECSLQMDSAGSYQARVSANEERTLAANHQEYQELKMSCNIENGAVQALSEILSEGAGTMTTSQSPRAGTMTTSQSPRAGTMTTSQSPQAATMTTSQSPRAGTMTTSQSPLQLKWTEPVLIKTAENTDTSLLEETCLCGSVVDSQQNDKDFGSVTTKVNQEGLSQFHSQDKATSETVTDSTAKRAVSNEAEKSDDRSVIANQELPFHDASTLCHSDRDVMGDMGTDRYTSQCDRISTENQNTCSTDDSSQLSNCAPTGDSADLGVFGLLEDNWSDEEWDEDAEQDDRYRQEQGDLMGRGHGLADDRTAPDSLGAGQNHSQDALINADNDESARWRKAPGKDQTGEVEGDMPSSGSAPHKESSRQSQGVLSLVSTTDTMYSSQRTLPDDLLQSQDKPLENESQDPTFSLRSFDNTDRDYYSCQLGQDPGRLQNDTTLFTSPDLFHIQNTMDVTGVLSDNVSGDTCSPPDLMIPNEPGFVLSTLPHPTELTKRKQADRIITNSDSNHDIADVAISKLAQYSVQGMQSSGVIYRGDSAEMFGNMLNQATRECLSVEQHDRLTDMDTVSVISVDSEDQLSSVQTIPSIKSVFSHVTSEEDFHSLDDVNTDSPCQKVPDQEAENDAYGVQISQFPGHRAFQKIPLISQPYSDEASVSSTSFGSFVPRPDDPSSFVPPPDDPSSSVQRRLPVWMQDSPELSFSESPITVRRNDRLMCQHPSGAQEYHGLRDLNPAEPRVCAPVLRDPVFIHYEGAGHSGQESAESPAGLDMTDDMGAGASKWDLYCMEEKPPPPVLYQGLFSPGNSHHIKYEKHNLTTFKKNCHSKFSAPRSTLMTMREDQSPSVPQHKTFMTLAAAVSEHKTFKTAAADVPQHKTFMTAAANVPQHKTFMTAAADVPQHKTFMTAAADVPQHKTFMTAAADVPEHKTFMTAAADVLEHKTFMTAAADVPEYKSFVTPKTDDSSGLLHSGSLWFPSQQDVQRTPIPQRALSVPNSFTSHHEYRSTWRSVIHELLNGMLFELAQRYFSALATVDVSKYGMDPGADSVSPVLPAPRNPPCDHGNPSKKVLVKKEGPNKGRFFFTCSGQRGQQCKFFQWVDQRSGKYRAAQSASLTDGHSISIFFKESSIPMYCECQLIRKSKHSYMTEFKKNAPPWVLKKMAADNGSQKSLFVKLPWKEMSSVYSKDDLWVVTRDLSFSDAFLARSVFYGPSADCEVELEAISSYSPSCWPSGALCHALHAGNASSELACLDNLEQHVVPASLPVLPHLLNRDPARGGHRTSTGFAAPRLMPKQTFYVPDARIDSLSEEYIDRYQLNEDQALALLKVSGMFKVNQQELDSLTLIHGVFGAGKSYLLAVIVLFLVEVFEANSAFCPDVGAGPLRVLVSSTTNVAVDRILLGLLELNFEDFVRVGSVKKIAKAVLPYSVHAVGSSELKDLQDMLKSEDLTSGEKMLVRRSIEQHRKGENKKNLSRVHVVGVTCAASAFQCLKDFIFPVVLLDECSQMTEPMSLLPIARYQCAKLVLVGDPKQLEPTIPGPEPAHKEGLEKTLFDRLQAMGHESIMLRTQYRCHPYISALPNHLFYGGCLRDGVAAQDRPPLVPGWPTLAFLDVPAGQERSSGSKSFYNEAEVSLLLGLLEVLVGFGVECTDIGVITLYKAQLGRMARGLQEKGALKGVQVSTVDAFQGGERSVVFLSCVRTDRMGFIDCHKRMNVALSRAKHHLFIVGHQRNLSKNATWNELLNNCAAHGDGIQNGPGFLRRKQQMLLAQRHDVEYCASSETGISDVNHNLDPPASPTGHQESRVCNDRDPPRHIHHSQPPRFHLTESQCKALFTMVEDDDCVVSEESEDDSDLVPGLF